MSTAELNLDELERIGKAAELPNQSNKWSDQPTFGSSNSCQLWVDSLYLGAINTGWIDESRREAVRDFCIAARNNWQAMIDRIRQLEETAEDWRRAFFDSHEGAD